jgi:hypothetical protein
MSIGTIIRGENSWRFKSGVGTHPETQRRQAHYETFSGGRAPTR